MPDTPTVSETDRQDPGRADSLESLRTRFDAIPSMVARFLPDAPPSGSEAALAAFADMHAALELHVLGADTVPGYRCAVVSGVGTPRAGAVRHPLVAAVRDDGLVVQGAFVDSFPDDEKPWLMQPPAAIARTALAVLHGTIPRETAQGAGAIPIVGWNRDEVDSFWSKEGWQETDADAPWLPLSGFSGAAARQARKTARLVASRTTDAATDAGSDASQAHADDDPFTEVEMIAEDRPGAQFYKVLERTFLQRERARLGAGARALSQALDSDVRTRMHALGLATPAAANMLAGGVPCAGVSESVVRDGHVDTAHLRVDPDARQRRGQAVDALPFLGRAAVTGLAHRTGLRMTREIGDPELPRALAGAIETGAPLVDAAAEAAGVPRAVVRRAGVQTWQKVGRRAADSPAHTLCRLRDVALAHIPMTRKGWQDLDATCAAAEIFAGLTDRSRRDVLRETGGRWDKTAALLEGNPASGMRDMHAALSQMIGVPLALSQADHAELERGLPKARRAAAPLMMEGHTLKSALQASARWHRNLPRITERFDLRGKDAAWSPLLGTLDTASGLSIEEVSSGHDLRQLGEAQDHCVGGYTRQVLNEESVIFAVREGRRTLSTMEISLDVDDATGKLTPTVAQHFGPSNAKPPAAAREAPRAVRTALAALSPAQVAAYRDGMAEIRVQETEQRANLEAGYDITDPAKRAESWEVMSAYLARGARKGGMARMEEKCRAAFRATARPAPSRGPQR